jgi:hypothetical protein
MVFVTWQMTLYGNPFPKSLLGIAHSIIGLVKSGFYAQLFSVET